MRWHRPVHADVQQHHKWDTDNTTVKVVNDATVYWVVAYSGDANNTGATSDCVESIAIDITKDEPVP